MKNNNNNMDSKDVIKWIAETDPTVSPSHYIFGFCFYCKGWMEDEIEQHNDGCIYIHARKLTGLSEET